MSKNDERLNYIQEWVDAHIFHNARADMPYLLDLVKQLRVQCECLAHDCQELEDSREYNADLIIERDAEIADLRERLAEAKQVAEVRVQLERIEVLRVALETANAGVKALKPEVQQVRHDVVDLIRERDDLRQRLEAAQVAIDERDIELAMLRGALDTIPLYEYGDAQREGCDAKGAWDCFKEALEKHTSAVRSITAVYDAKNNIADLRQRLAAVTALVPSADWLEMVALAPRPIGPDNCTDCPFWNGDTGRCEDQCDKVDTWATVFADAIRAWRGAGDGREERGGEAMGSLRRVAQRAAIDRKVRRMLRK